MCVITASITREEDGSALTPSERTWDLNSLGNYTLPVCSDQRMESRSHTSHSNTVHTHTHTHTHTWQPLITPISRCSHVLAFLFLAEFKSDIVASLDFHQADPVESISSLPARLRYHQKVDTHLYKRLNIYITPIFPLTAVRTIRLWRVQELGVEHWIYNKSDVRPQALKDQPEIFSYFFLWKLRQEVMLWWRKVGILHVSSFDDCLFKYVILSLIWVKLIRKKLFTWQHPIYLFMNL